MVDPLDAVSPLDGRYASQTAPLQSYMSEAALIRARTRVEIEYLIALSDLPDVPLTLSPDERAEFRGIYENFDAADAELIKEIETVGYGDIPATNHDVKAIEYFLRDHLPEQTHPWIHFGLTSEDVTNLAYRLLLRDGIEAVVRPVLQEIRTALVEFAQEYRSVPMLARTHGQPATPTTFGKEMAVFASRLDRGLDRLDTTLAQLAGKLAGASGTYAAHAIALPDVDWPTVSESFVTGLGLDHIDLTTQVNPGDDLAAVFDSLRGVNQILIDLDRDVWLYVSNRYLGQESADEETGSSTMPHKVNPIDFENAEGNLSKANSDLVFLGEWITTSRLQRDLTDSTIKRNMGAAIGYSYLGYLKTRDGLHSVVPNEQVMREDLRAHPEILAEAFQTILRREGHADAYEQIKTLTRGREVTLEDLRAAVADLDVSPDVQTELETIEPEAYTGLASALIETLES